MAIEVIPQESKGWGQTWMPASWETWWIAKLKVWMKMWTFVLF